MKRRCSRRESPPRAHSEGEVVASAGCCREGFRLQANNISEKDENLGGLSVDFCLAICRAQVLFADSAGAEKSILSTGFWLLTRCKREVFVLNRHTLDVGYQRDEYKDFSLKRIEIELRDISFGKDCPISRMCLVGSYEHVYSEDADVVILFDIQFGDKPEGFSWQCLNASEWLADDAFFKKYCGITQEISFVGFPHGKYDEEGHFPIAGHAIVSSVPTRSFKSRFIKSNDIILVEGKSLSGSSGSPIITFSRGLRVNVDVGGPVETADYCPQKLLGIMSGHLEHEGNQFFHPNPRLVDSLNHSGKAYFVRSTSILKLLDSLTALKCV
jgi:hypothetical protein